VTVNNAVPHRDEPKTRLIELAARITDLQTSASSTGHWLRAFRRNYRHMAVTYGDRFDVPGNERADRETDEALSEKATAGSA
jgi:hypothetical protein